MTSPYGSPPPLARFVGRRPAAGPAAAAKAVAEDVSTLLRAELDLAKAEVEDAIKAKATGVGLFAGAGVLGWLGINALLVTLGFVLAIWLPGWAAALIVTLLLFGAAAIVALIGKKKLAMKLSIEMAKTGVAKDVEVTKQGLQHVVQISRNGEEPQPAPTPVHAVPTAAIPPAVPRPSPGAAP